jgi:hypothetical protein
MSRRHGPTPELAYILAGYREAGRLAGLGIRVPRDRWAELGRTVLEHAPPLEPAERDRLLDQAREQNQVARLELEQAPEPGEGTPKDLSPGAFAGLEQGRPRTAARGDGKGPVRKMTIEDFLKESHDEHEEWS